MVAACASTPRPGPGTTGQAVVIVSGDAVEEARVRDAVRRVLPALQRFGGLDHPVSVLLMPDHRALEAAVGQEGTPWLRAWARYDTVHLQAPGTWALRQVELDRLLLHELTHCVLFQQIGTASTWRARDVPLWFREGMALYAAGQRSELPTLEDLARYLSGSPRPDVFRDGERLSREDNRMVYGLSYHAFQMLLRRYGGEAGVRDLLGAMAAGNRFDDAFQAVHGLTVDAFQRDVENFVVWRGFRGTGRPVR